MLKEKYPFYLANRPEMPNADLKVVDKYTGKVVTRVAVADERTIDKAIEAAHKSVEALRAMPAYKRQEVLYHLVDI